MKHFVVGYLRNLVTRRSFNSTRWMLLQCGVTTAIITGIIIIIAGVLRGVHRETEKKICLFHGTMRLSILKEWYEKERNELLVKEIGALSAATPVIERIVCVSLFETVLSVTIDQQVSVIPLTFISAPDDFLSSFPTKVLCKKESSEPFFFIGAPLVEQYPALLSARGTVKGVRGMIGGTVQWGNEYWDEGSIFLSRSTLDKNKKFLPTTHILIFFAPRTCREMEEKLQRKVASFGAGTPVFWQKSYPLLAHSMAVEWGVMLTITFLLILASILVNSNLLVLFFLNERKNILWCFLQGYTVRSLILFFISIVGGIMGIAASFGGLFAHIFFFIADTYQCIPLPFDHTFFSVHFLPYEGSMLLGILLGGIQGVVAAVVSVVMIRKIIYSEGVFIIRA